MIFFVRMRAADDQINKKVARLRIHHFFSDVLMTRLFDNDAIDDRCPKPTVAGDTSPVPLDAKC